MASQDELHKRIADDLKKSGFGAELRALEEFEISGWRAVTPWVFYDTLQPQAGPRSVDIHATKDISKSVAGNGADAKTVALTVLAEVKKSDDPWVVLKCTPQFSFHAHFTVDPSLITVNGESPSLQLAMNFLSQHTVFSRTRWLGHGVRESFKAPSKASQPSFWFKAVSSVSRAAILTATSVPEEIGGKQGSNTIVRMIQPLVILEGPLFSAEGKHLHIEKIDQATMFHRQSLADSNRELFVDLITATALPEYLKMLEGRLELVLDEIRGI